MKKFLLFVFFTLCSICVNASVIDARMKTINSNAYLVNNDSIIVIEKEFKPIYRYLDLKNYQYNEFKGIHSDLCKAIIYLENKKEDGVRHFNNHLKYDLQNSSYILDKDQYHKYLRAVNITLLNKGLINYVLEDLKD